MFGFGDVVHTYSAAAAISDGYLVQPAPTKFPNWLLSRAVHDAIEQHADSRTYDQRVIPLIMDGIRITRRHRDDLHTKGLEGNITGRELWIASNELGGYTILFPEDY